MYTPILFLCTLFLSGSLKISVYNPFLLKNIVNDRWFGFQFDVNLDAVTKSEAKSNPRDRFGAQFRYVMDPRAQPTEHTFPMDYQIKRLTDCDTLHLLFLMQIALDLHRQWVIERNQYFESISRTDRYIYHVDGPQVITNLLKWYNEDKRGNVFDGKMLQNNDGHAIIHSILVTVGM